MDDEQNLEFRKEDEKAINLVKSASKNLKDVKKRVLRNEKEAEKNLEKVRNDGLEEIKKAKLNLQSATAYKSSLTLKKRSLGLIPEPGKKKNSVKDGGRVDKPTGGRVVKPGGTGARVAKSGGTGGRVVKPQVFKSGKGDLRVKLDLNRKSGGDRSDKNEVCKYFARGFCKNNDWCYYTH